MTLLEGSRTIAGLKLRPFTFGSFEACSKLGLTLFTGGAETITNEEAMRQMIAFAWIQSVDIDTLLDTFSKGQEQREIDKFKWSLDLSSIDQITTEVQRIGEAIKATVVEVVPKPTRGNEETPPPN